MLHTAGRQVLGPDGTPVSLRCVNLSPWLNREPYLIRKSVFALFKSPHELEQKLVDLVGPAQAQSFWDQWEEAFVMEEDFERLHKLGFNCVRLPLNYRKLAIENTDGSISLRETGVSPVDRAVGWASKHKLFVMITLHTASGGQNNIPTVADVSSSDAKARLWESGESDAHQTRIVRLWHELAKRYANSASVGAYDVLNEPNLPSGIKKAQLPALYSRIIETIRSVDPHHMIILEGDDFARDFSAFAPPADANIMYEFHEYSIFNSRWKKPNLLALQPFLKLRDAHNVPLWLGEFGEDSFAWQESMVELMKENGIGWAVWPWKRVHLGEDRPVMQTVLTTPAWNELVDFLISVPFSRRPPVVHAQQAMSDMLTAIRSENCRENRALATMLSGQE